MAIYGITLRKRIHNKISLSWNDSSSITDNKKRFINFNIPLFAIQIWIDQLINYVYRQCRHAFRYQFRCYAMTESSKWYTVWAVSSVIFDLCVLYMFFAWIRKKISVPLRTHITHCYIHDDDMRSVLRQTLSILHYQPFVVIVRSRRSIEYSAYTNSENTSYAQQDVVSHFSQTSHNAHDW